jgi:hypothetical protein
LFYITPNQPPTINDMRYSPLFLLVVPSIVAFTPSSKPSRSIQYPYPKHISSILDDDSKAESENEFEGFNPFNRKNTKTPQRAPQVFSSTISLRQMRMKDLMTNLLNADDSRMQNLLLENEELLMEPLLEDDAVLDKDSIYDRGMSMEERFDRYESAMVEREEKAVNKSVARILVAMREFVMIRRKIA